MANALSNPYEITAGGVTCKCSPFGSGHYISDDDLEKLSDDKAKSFRDALFSEYEIEQSKELRGIKVFGPKSAFYVTPKVVAERNKPTKTEEIIPASKKVVDEKINT